MYEVVIGRTESDRKKLGLTGTVFLGKHYVKMGAITSLSNKVYMDVSRAHVIFIVGKRGTGKCLHGDTLITLADGSLKPIKELENDNNKILSLNYSTNKLETRSWTKFFKRKVNKLLYVKLNCGKEIKLTPEHPLFTTNGWVQAKLLSINSEIAVRSDKKILMQTEKGEVESDIFWDEIVSMEYLEGEFEVYDIAVPETHNFIANDIIVHNSYAMGVMAEEMANLPDEIKNRLAILIFDTMGIYWTMKFKNEKDEDLLREWDLPQKTLDVAIYTPAGNFDDYKQRGIPTDFKFTIRPNELMPTDWVNVFGLGVGDQVAVAIELAIGELEGKNYSISDIITEIQNHKKVEEKTKVSAEARFLAAKKWGLFSDQGTPISEIIKAGQVSVLDISCYQDWNVKNLVVGLISRRLMIERMASRKKEELSDIESGHSYFSQFRAETKDEMPMVWLLADEAHEMLPKEGKTPATDALVQILREGRQPGISLILVTQQPGEVHKDVTTQSDIVICHRITARKDIDALNSMMQSYSGADIMKYLNNLPRLVGSALVLDDNSERMYPIRVRPRFTWHGGEAPVAVKAKGSAVEELGL